MATNKYHGVAVSFGIGSSISTFTGLMQTFTHNYEGDTETGKGPLGSTAFRADFDPKERSTFTIVVSDGTAASGDSAFTLPSKGDNATVSDTKYPAIAGSTWIVDNVDVEGSNTAAARAVCKMTRYSDF